MFYSEFIELLRYNAIMQSLGEYGNNYLDELKNRSSKSRAFKSHQLAGLEIAAILGDFKNKSLYIKLAKEYDSGKLMGLAKSIAENKNINNPGAYFMRLLHGPKKDENRYRRQPKKG
ncbi:MAG: hypothetical protein Q8O87_01915 [bacterium]|nr:hypothetical protein [bacterium]